MAMGVADLHGVPMKPSFMPMMNKADLLLLVGLDCEPAFLPALLEAEKIPASREVGPATWIDIYISRKMVADVE